MRRFLAVSIAVVILCMTGASAGRPQDAEPVKKLMSLKLDYTRQILESVIRQDFESLRELSFRLSVLTATADWKVFRTEEYFRYTSDFRRAVEVFREAPRHRDIDRAAKAYTNMTLECVRCHKYVRKAQEISTQ